MGCCISSNKKFPHQPKPPVMPEPDINNRVNTAPPPSLPCLEEETVKEVVLSDIPSPIPQQNPKDKTTQMAIIQECNNIVAKDLNLTIKKHQQEEEEETSQVSQVSEIYSISESFSATTTTTTTTVALTEIKDDKAISKETSRELNYRSPAKVPRKRPNAREISRVAKSPVMSRPVPGRTVPCNVGPTAARRESGVGFSSRSPATGTAGGVQRRSPGKATTGRAGGKLRVKNEGKKEVNDGVLVGKSELYEPLPLDNHPRVSLECFIFL